MMSFWGGRSCSPSAPLAVPFFARSSSCIECMFLEHQMRQDEENGNQPQRGEALPPHLYFWKEIWSFLLAACSRHGLFSSLFPLVCSRSVGDHNQAHDFAIRNGKVVRQDQVARRKVGFVVGALNGPSDNGLSIVLDHFTHLHRHLIANQLFLHPSPDRITPPEFSPYIVDEGIISEGRHDSIGIKSVQRRDVLGDHRMQRVRHEMLLFICFSWPTPNGRP